MARLSTLTRQPHRGTLISMATATVKPAGLSVDGQLLRHAGAAILIFVESSGRKGLAAGLVAGQSMQGCYVEHFT